MRQKFYFLFFILLLGLYLLLMGCNGTNGGTNKTLRSVLISPASVTVRISTTQKFSALGLYSDNSVAAISPTWGVSTSCGTIDTAGLFYAASSAGSGEIVATYEEITGTAQVIVSTSTTAALSSIEVTPSTYTGKVGQNRTFTAVGKNGSNETMAISPAWSVTGGIGTITNGGIFTATAEGTGGIVCTSGEVSKTVVATIDGYSVIITTDATTYVDSALPTTEFSTSTELNISYTYGTPAHIQDSYISFDVSSVPVSASVESATLYVYVVSASLKSYVLKKINNTWTPTMTYNTRPSTTGYTYINSLDSPSAGGFNAVDVTDLVSTWVATPASNKGIYFYKPTTDDGGMVLLSKQGLYPPYLVVVYE